MQFNKDGWLFENSLKNEIHYINDKEIEDLLELAKEEIEWQKRVREEVMHRDILSANGENPLIDMIRMHNTDGVIIDFPYGKRIITFSTTRHFFRGENQIYHKSVPSLNRKIDLMDQKEKELYRIVANLRILRFSKFIWKFNIVPFWEAKLSDVNYKALAQHYGFETHLLDLTNDFNVALFFATCKYVPETDSYRPLTKEDIEKNNNTQYGVIYHSPNWVLDFQNFGEAALEFMFRRIEWETYEVDSGKFDDIAFQIGYQPLMRCAQQSGYIFPMRNSKSLQENNKFEKIYFKQSPELSKMVFDMMEGGKKVFPDEGISKAKKYIDEIKETTIFLEDDLKEIYEYDVDKNIFPTLKYLKDELCTYKINGKNIEIVSEEIEYNIDKETLKEINDMYDNRDLLELVGGQIYMKPEHKRYFKAKCIEIYGREI